MRCVPGPAFFGGVLYALVCGAVPVCQATTRGTGISASSGTSVDWHVHRAHSRSTNDVRQDTHEVVETTICAQRELHAVHKHTTFPPQVLHCLDTTKRR